MCLIGRLLSLLWLVHLRYQPWLALTIQDRLLLASGSGISSILSQSRQNWGSHCGITKTFPVSL